MKRLFVVLSTFLTLGLLSCASIPTVKLKEGMTKQEVKRLMGEPKSTHFNSVGDNRIEVWDYIKYGFTLVPAHADYDGSITRKARLWFLNDELKLWQSAEWRRGEYPALSRPPDFESPGAPDFILEIRGK